MKSNFFQKIVLAVFCFGVVVNIQANKKSNNTSDMFIKQIVAAWMQKNNVPGVAVEFYQQGIPHSYYLGYADKEKKTPVSEKTIFELGSITKLFTSLLLVEEVNASGVKLDDSIAEYAPDLSPNGKFQNITIENLLTHTSGFPLNAPAQVQSRSALQDYLGNWKPAAAIGSEWNYSNINFGLLGYALEVITSQNYNQLYRTRILQPLNMSPIGITVPQAFLSDYAQGYDKIGQPVKPEPTGLFPAAGALKASGHDMLQFLKAAMGLPGTPVSVNEAMRMTQTPYVSTSSMQQGLGWVISPITAENMSALLNPAKPNLGPLPATQLPPMKRQFSSDSLIDKTGATQGFQAYIAVIPKRKLGVVILANRYVGSAEIMKLGREILLNSK